MSVDIAANPYQSPQIDEAPLPVENAYTGSPRRAIAFWGLSFALNLPVAFFFGFAGTDDAGKLGMFAGIGVLAIAGALLVAWSRLAGKVIIRGGLLFAISQFYPILQIMAGFLAAGLLQALGVSENAPASDVGLVGGFLATLVVGAMIIAAGAAVGLILLVLTPRRWWRDENATNIAADSIGPS